MEKAGLDKRSINPGFNPCICEEPEPDPERTHMCTRCGYPRITHAYLDYLVEEASWLMSLDHYIEYQNGMFTLVRGEKRQGIGDRRLYTALSPVEFLHAIHLYTEGFRASPEGEKRLGERIERQLKEFKEELKEERWKKYG
jgi:hypothetical protein